MTKIAMDKGIVFSVIQNYFIFVYIFFRSFIFNKISNNTIITYNIYLFEIKI